MKEPSEDNDPGDDAPGNDRGSPVSPRVPKNPAARPPHKHPAAPILTQMSRRAMATEFVVMLPSHAAEAAELVFATLEQLDKIENRLTIYQPDSEVSRINRLAEKAPVKVSAATFKLLEKAILWSERTGGAFDVTSGPLVQAWGFTQRRGQKPSNEAIDSARQCVGYQSLQLDREQCSIRFLKPQMSINLGAIGKGDAIDQIAAKLHLGGLHDFLIHGGQSSVLAAGDQCEGSGEGWAVGLSHPTKPKRRLAGIRLRDMALATSGSGKQFFHYRGRRYGHVIDPRTGYPAGDLAALTVIMKSAADADACATGLFVAGSESITNLEDSDWLPSIVAVREGERQDSVEVQSYGVVPWVDPPESHVSRRSRDASP